MDTYHFAYRSALPARSSFKIGGNTVSFSASLIRNYFASHLATTLTSAVAASCSSLHISDEATQVVRAAQRPVDILQELLSFLAPLQLSTFGDLFMISKSTPHNVHLMPQERSPAITSNKQGYLFHLQRSPWLCVCVAAAACRSDHAMQENCVTFRAASQQRVENCWVTGTHTRQWTQSITTK